MKGNDIESTWHEPSTQQALTKWALLSLPFLCQSFHSSHLNLKPVLSLLSSLSLSFLMSLLKGWRDFLMFLFAVRFCDFLIPFLPLIKGNLTGDCNLKPVFEGQLHYCYQGGLTPSTPI